MPRSPTKTSSVIPNRVRSVCTCAGTVTGSAVWPSYTWTAKGSPAAVVNSPITIGAFARLLVPAIPKGCQGIVFPLQVRGGHVIQDHRGSATPLPCGPVIERVLNVLLRLGQAIECLVEVIFIKVLQPERLGDGVLGGPADRGEAGALGGDTGQDEKQDEFGPTLGAEHLKQPDALSQLLERKQHGEDGTTDGLWRPREAIELALEGTAQGVDPLRRPGSQIGEGPRADLAPVAEGFAQENGRRRVAIRNSGDIHEWIYTMDIPLSQEDIGYLHDYIMARKIDESRNFSEGSAQMVGGRSVSLPPGRKRTACKRWMTAQSTLPTLRPGGCLTALQRLALAGACPGGRR